jgi:hypothetical protein
MWKVEFRPMTPEERSELQRVRLNSVRPWRDRMESWVGRLFGAGRSPAALLKEALLRDLENGKVQVIHATAADAVRLANSDGSLAGFFVDIGTGLAMFVEPREWDSPAAASDFERLFPCTRFSLIRAPHSGVDLDFLCEGRRFESTREIEAPDPEILDAVIEDGEILAARLSSLEDDLERLLTHSHSGAASREAVGSGL